MKTKRFSKNKINYKKYERKIMNKDIRRGNKKEELDEGKIYGQKTMKETRKIMDDIKSKYFNKDGKITDNTRELMLDEMKKILKIREKKTVHIFKKIVDEDKYFIHMVSLIYKEGIGTFYGKYLYDRGYTTVDIVEKYLDRFPDIYSNIRLDIENAFRNHERGLINFNKLPALLNMEI